MSGSQHLQIPLIEALRYLLRRISLSTVTYFFLHKRIDRSIHNHRIILATFCDDEKTSNRIDDNVETLQKRFRQYEEETVPCVHKLKEENKLVEVTIYPQLTFVHLS